MGTTFSIFGLCTSSSATDAAEPDDFESRKARLKQGRPVLSESQRRNFTRAAENIAATPSRADRKASEKLWKVLYHVDVGDIELEAEPAREFWKTIQNGFGVCELHAEDMPYSHVLLHLDLPTELDRFEYAAYVTYAQQKLCMMQAAQCSSKVIRTPAWQDRGWKC